MARDSSSADGAVAVTPSDSASIATCRALYIGVAGDVTVAPKNGGTVTFKAHPVGYMVVRVTAVKATGTTATDILALY